MLSLSLSLYLFYTKQIFKKIAFRFIQNYGISLNEKYPAYESRVSFFLLFSLWKKYYDFLLEFYQKWKTCRISPPRVHANFDFFYLTDVSDRLLMSLIDNYGVVTTAIDGDDLRFYSSGIFTGNCGTINHAVSFLLVFF